jgi:hypothetical protein
MLIGFVRGQASVILRVKILDSSVTTGAGKTGLVFNTAGLIVSTIADNEATAVSYGTGAGTIEDITTIGTYAAPTASKCRFKAVDATNHPGVYEIHLADARFAVASAKYLIVSIHGAANAAQCDVLIPLMDFNPYSTTAFSVNVTQWAGLNVVAMTSERNLMADAWLDRVDGIETGVTPRAAWRRIAATTAGKVSGAGSGTEIFLGLDGLTTRVTVTVDASGNRTGIVYA